MAARFSFVLGLLVFATGLATGAEAPNVLGVRPGMTKAEAEPVLDRYALDTYKRKWDKNEELKLAPSITGVAGTPFAYATYYKLDGTGWMKTPTPSEELYVAWSPPGAGPQRVTLVQRKYSSFVSKLSKQNLVGTYRDKFGREGGNYQGGHLWWNWDGKGKPLVVDSGGASQVCEVLWQPDKYARWVEYSVDPKYVRELTKQGLESRCGLALYLQADAQGDLVTHFRVSLSDHPAFLKALRDTETYLKGGAAQLQQQEENKVKANKLPTL